MERTAPSDAGVLTFGPFTLVPEKRLLLRADEPVRLGSRAFDILVLLAGKAGDVVGKAELIRGVWPETFVEEANLRVHVAGLRKALGDDPQGQPYIANVPGRGYSLMAGVTRGPNQGAPQPGPARALALPAPVSRTIGRDDTIRHLCETVRAHRLVTIVGPGGIGKTTVAVRTGQAVAAEFRDGVAFVDLSSLQDETLVPAALAGALGRSLRSGSATEELAQFLQDQHILIILDNCEHLLNAATELAEAFLRATAGVRFIATSREPLRAEGEWVHRLPPLDCPPPATDLSQGEALRFPAVELFVERASAGLGGFALSDGDVPAVSDICRRLDGIALAVELAAARLGSAGLAGLARSLDDRFRVLTRGRRTALPRHQTLRATLDWSYDLLSPAEQRVFRRLGMPAGFGLGAIECLSPEDAPEADDLLESLCAKSLVVPELGDPEPRYRMLETTRAYAREKLAEAGETDLMARRHAAHVRALFEQAEVEWEHRPTAEWLSAYMPDLGNLRAALDWSLSAEGSAEIGVALTVAAVPFLFQLSLVDECLARVEKAFTVLNDLPGDTRPWRMRLHTVLGWPQMRSLGPLKTGPTAWVSVLALARELGNVDYQLRALWALWVDRTNSGAPREALALADEFLALAERAEDPAEIAIAQRLRARALHLLGRQDEARASVERMLATYEPPPRRSHLARYLYDQRITAHITRQRVLWLLGCPDQAIADVSANIEAAQALDHGLTLCHALSDGACPIALLVGDLDLADRYTTLLWDLTAAKAMDVWHTYARAYRGEILWRRGQRAVGLQLMLKASERMRDTGFVLYLSAFSLPLALALAETGEVDAALGWLDQSLVRCEQSGEGWCVPELLRVKGEILLRAGEAAAGGAYLQRACERAAADGAPAWELRAASSLARHGACAPGGGDASAHLGTVLGRFGEGAGTADHTEARSLLPGP